MRTKGRPGNGKRVQKGDPLMKRFSVQATRGRFKIEALIQKIGEDLLVAVWGGTRPHIGAVGIATPRPSLRDPKQWSATSSNFTFIGHKEDLLARKMSEELAARFGRNVVVTAGIHWDELTPKEVKEIEGLTDEITVKILRKSGRKGTSRRSSRVSTLSE